MTGEEARELFSPAREGELEAEVQAAFDAALAADRELRADYDEFRETLALVGRLGERDEAPPPDLRHRVQRTLRQRSRGRYYRDRFAEGGARGVSAWVLLVMAALLLLLVAWLAYDQLAGVTLDAPGR